MNSNCLLVLLVLVAVGVLLTRSDPPAGTECAKVKGQPNCVCHHPNGTIDLTPLSSKDGPRFNGSDLVDTKGFRYFYNPCLTFSYLDGCHNVYACQETADQKDQYPLADENTEKLYYDVDNDPTSVILYYSSHTTNGLLREVRVHLICDKNFGTGREKLTTTGDTESVLNYKFTLTTCHACPGGCGGGGKGSIAGGIGLALIFLFIFGLLAYFIIGAVIMQVHFKKTGVDIIPNKGFWFLLPVLIKEGFLFTISPCMGSRSNYEKM